MTMIEKGTLDVLLFESEGEELLDVKCFRGDRADVTAEEIQAQMHAGFMQLKLHPDIKSSVAPYFGIKAVDMVELSKMFAVPA